MILNDSKHVEEECAKLYSNAEQTLKRINSFAGTPMSFLFTAKFEDLGTHPVSGKPLNFIEQLNQTFTFLAAYEAAKLLFAWHDLPDGLQVYPGAHAPRGTLDIEANELPGFVGAETFASVSPSNNGKLKKDLSKLSARNEKFRYSFFISPRYPEFCRQKELEVDDIQVWSLWPF